MSKPTPESILSILNKFPGLLQTSFIPMALGEMDGFVQIGTVKKEMSSIKTNMDGILDALKEQDSFLNRIATFWGEQSTWSKILVGTLVFAPVVLIGVVAAILDLIVLGVVGAALYMACSVALDNHYTMNQLNHGLRKGISSLGGLLQTTVGALDDIDAHLRADIDRLKEQNTALAQSLHQLRADVVSLKKELLDLETIKEKLRVTEVRLGETMEKSSAVNASLADKVRQLDLAETRFKAHVTALSQLAVVEGDRREDFLTHLDEFIAKHLDQSSELLYKTQTELAGVRVALEQSNERYEHLLDQHSSEVHKLSGQVLQLERLLTTVGDPKQQGRDRFFSSSVKNGLIHEVLPRHQWVAAP